MIRFFFYIIIFLLISKVIELLLRFIRALSAPKTNPIKEKNKYLNIEDADYEDITDKNEIC